MRIAVRTVKGRQFPRFTGQVLERDRQLVFALPVRSQHVDARTSGLLMSRFLFSGDGGHPGVAPRSDTGGGGLRPCPITALLADQRRRCGHLNPVELLGKFHILTPDQWAALERCF